MVDLDLREVRCPMALVLLKQQLIKMKINECINIKFSNQQAMQDICLYLDKKNYCYLCEQNTLLIKLYNRF
ncbi:sulfurtransferase TusA family protein [Psychromonas sp. RZ22]|nr:sulfurtransferase TusA family protein [Psychromonas sp. RZ22]TEW53702.1 sulfurtransferase TusA family protein [Psychromonas sp. RZ22]